jgi:hypothetical protein
MYGYNSNGSMLEDCSGRLNQEESLGSNLSGSRPMPPDLGRLIEFFESVVGTFRNLHNVNSPID